MLFRKWGRAEELIYANLPLFLILEAVSLTITAIFNFRALTSVLAASMLPFFFIFFGQKLYIRNTTENWLSFSMSDSIRKIIGAILLIFGWLIFLDAVLASAIASLFLFFS